MASMVLAMNTPTQNNHCFALGARRSVQRCKQAPARMDANSETAMPPMLPTKDWGHHCVTKALTARLTPKWMTNTL